VSLLPRNDPLSLCRGLVNEGTAHGESAVHLGRSDGLLAQHPSHGSAHHLYLHSGGICAPWDWASTVIRSVGGRACRSPPMWCPPSPGYCSEYLPLWSYFPGSRVRRQRRLRGRHRLRGAREAAVQFRRVLLEQFESDSRDEMRSGLREIRAACRQVRQLTKPSPDGAWYEVPGERERKMFAANRTMVRVLRAPARGSSQRSIGSMSSRATGTKWRPPYAPTSGMSVLLQFSWLRWARL
jgi:hypothetical protein